LEFQTRVRYQRLADQAALVDLETGRTFPLTPTAARWWELTATGATVEEIRALLSDEFGVPATVLEREIESLLARLRREKLLVEPASA
jgi:hypothetical protein